jgi:ABC-type antimicrobial peptide transport system permease subunit
LSGQINLDTDLTPIGNSIQAALPNDRLTVFDWHQMLPSNSAYLRVFDRIVLVAYIIAFVAMGFGIANTVLMAVYERMREFGLLMALGMRPLQIIQMILLETAMLLLIGMALGNLAGFAGVYYLSEGGIDLTMFSNATELFGYSRIIYPVVITQDILLANAVVFLLGLMVGLYPAVKASRFMPVDIIRRQ